MLHTLFCHWTSSSPTAVTWFACDAKGQLQTPVQTGELSQLPTAKRVYGLLPSTDILLAQVDVPSKQRQRLLQAVPFVLEEQLAEEIENLHFAVGERDKVSGLIPVAVLERAHLQTYLEAIQETGLVFDAIVPEVLAVPLPPQGWGLLLLGNTLLVRTGAYTGFAVELNNALTWLQFAINEAGENAPSLLQVYASGTTHWTQDLNSLGIPVQVQTEAQGEYAWLSKGMFAAPPLDLLQGEYRPSHALGEFWKPWRLTAALLLLGVLIYGGQLWTQSQQLAQQRTQLSQQIEQVYRETFPESKKIVNPRAQMEQQLKQLRNQRGQGGSDTDFLSQLVQLSPSLKQSTGLLLKRLEFRQGRFELEMDLGSLQAVEQLKQSWVQQGFQVEIAGMNSRQNGVELKMKVAKK